MKIAILSSFFPPEHSGLADHTRCLARELSRMGHTLCIWTAQANPTPELGMEVRTFTFPWDSNRLRQIQQDMTEWSPDHVYIQYTPQSIAPKNLGVNLLFPFWILGLKRALHQKICIVFHELHYPVQFSLRGILIGFPQWLQFWLLVLFSDVLFFTTEPVWKRISKHLFWRNQLHWLPVGANLESNAMTDLQRSKVQFGMSPETHLLLYFGGLHPTHLVGHMKKALLKAVETYGAPSVLLVCIGVKSETLRREFASHGDQELLKSVRNLEYLPERLVVEWLGAADLILAPFMDGISTRRSSAMAAFQEGKAVLSTWGTSSNGSIPWSEFCEVPSVDSVDDYASRAVLLLSSPLRLKELGRKAKEFYLERFSWSKIAGELLSKSS